MWYDSREFSTTTFQLHGKSPNQVAAKRYGGSNAAPHSSGTGDRNSRRLGPSSAMQTNTASPHVSRRNFRSREFSRSHGRNDWASGMRPVQPLRSYSQPWYW